MPMRDVFLNCLANLLFGLTIPLTAYVLRDYPASIFGLLRASFAVVALLCIARIQLKNILRVAPYAFLGNVFPIVCLIFALKLSGDGAAVALAMQTVPIFAVVIAALALGEKADAMTWFGVALSGIGGTILVYSADAISSLGGIVLAIAAAAFYGASQVILRRLQTVPPLEVQAWSNLFAVCVWLAIGMAQHHAILDTVISTPGAVLVVALFAGLASSLAGPAILTWLLARYPVYLVSPFSLLTTLSAAGVAVIIGAPVTSRLAIGGTMILIGSVVVYLAMPAARSKAFADRVGK